jgi:hypothetical protein
MCSLGTQQFWEFWEFWSLFTIFQNREQFERIQV